MEEHRVMMRNGKVVNGTEKGHPDDVSREDLVALDPGESTIIYRGFRDFVGPYVAHCHNLAHEDHAMSIVGTVSVIRHSITRRVRESCDDDALRSCCCPDIGGCSAATAIKT